MHMEPKSNVEWRKWAQDDPLYGIATRSERHRNGKRPWTLPEFYEYGALNWSEYYPHWCRYGVNPKSCLEIGCGAGRITRQLVRCFGSVYGIDISSDMLRIAQDNVTGAKFLLSGGMGIPLPDASVSAVFSSEVFRHFDRRDIALSYFREIHRVLFPQGTFMVQLPIVALPQRDILPAMDDIQRFFWQFMESWVRTKANVKRWLISHRNRRSFLFLIEYEPEWLLSHLSEIGFSDIEIQWFTITGDPREKYIDAFLFARKS